LAKRKGRKAKPLLFDILNILVFVHFASSLS
jgi:hypothetical protein